MALSEREQELFDQLEKQLQDDDPQLAAALAPAPVPTVSTRRVVLGVLLTLAGFLTLIAGVMVPEQAISIFVGILGFTMMGAGISIASTLVEPGPAAR